MVGETRADAVIPSERGETLVIPSERSESLVIPSERSESRDQHPVTTRADRSLVAALAPIMAVVLVAYLVIGVAMPVLPLYVHQELGLGTFVVGIAAGVQFAAALVSRFWAGTYADTRGAKRAVVAGLLMGAAAGFLYLVSLRVAHAPTAAIAVYSRAASHSAAPRASSSPAR